MTSNYDYDYDSNYEVTCKNIRISIARVILHMYYTYMFGVKQINTMPTYTRSFSNLNNLK